MQAHGGTGESRGRPQEPVLERLSRRSRRVAVAERPRPRVDLAALFGPSPDRWAWGDGARAAVAMAVAFTCAAWLVDAPAGVLAALGSFTVLYERNTPYAHRAGALTMIGLGFVGCVAVGSLSAVTPWTAAVAIGLVGGVATWVCQSLRVDRPAAFLFVLVCAIATILPGGLAEVATNAALTMFGATVGWLVAMSGALFRGRDPEHQAVAAAFDELAALLGAVGGPRQDHAQHQASVAVAEAWRMVLLGQTRGYRDTADAARLRALLRWVSDIQLTATDVALARTDALPREAVAFTERLGVAVLRPDTAPDPADLDEARRGHRPRSLESRLYTGLARAAQAARSTEHTPEGRGQRLHDRRHPPAGEALRSGLRRDSLVRPTALRMAITVTAAGLLAVALGEERFYWVPLTAASVLQGGNVVLTVNRAAQRSVGTVLGVVIGAALLLPGPPLPAVIVIAALFHGLTWVVMPRSFFYATVALTPMALILAFTAAPYPVDQLAYDRVVDTLLGSVVGALGALLLWRGASATRLAPVVGDALRRSQTAVAMVTDPAVTISAAERYRLRRDLRAALLSLRGVYDSAIGDVPRARSTRPLWPVVVATQRIGYLALAALALERPPRLSYIALQRIDLAFAELVRALRERRAPRLGALPHLTDYPQLSAELRALAAALRAAAATDGTGTTGEDRRQSRRELHRARAEAEPPIEP